eukprot:m.15187 g.15187  ORF g.15187 m.15187 type:complete len:281 (-) comp7820_c0_seq2:268-1110(-)
MDENDQKEMDGEVVGEGEVEEEVQNHSYPNLKDEEEGEFEEESFEPVSQAVDDDVNYNQDFNEVIETNTAADDPVLYETYLVWTVLKQMCHDRGYLVNEETMNMEFEEWVENYGDKERKDLSFAVHKDTGDAMDQMLVVFPPTDDVSRNMIKGLYEKMRKENIYRAIVVVYKKIASVASQAIRNMRGMNPPVVMEVFYKQELVLNVTKHVYVPKHEILTQEEKEQLLARYKIKDHNLPLMQENDPVSKYYGLSPGQVVRIIRPSETAGLYVTYRLVSKSL